MDAAVFRCALAMRQSDQSATEERHRPGSDLIYLAPSLSVPRQPEGASILCQVLVPHHGQVPEHSLWASLCAAHRMSSGAYLG